MSAKEIIEMLLVESESEKKLSDFTTDLVSLKRKLKFVMRYLNALKSLEEVVRSNDLAMKDEDIASALGKIDKLLDFD